MNGATIRFRVQFVRQRESRLVTPPAAAYASVLPQGGRPVAAGTATPIARLLALAHHVERLVEAGELKDYAEAARRLGMAKSHMTHVTNLLSLAPDIQEAVLAGRLTMTEHALREVCRVLPGSRQRGAGMPLCT